MIKAYFFMPLALFLAAGCSHQAYKNGDNNESGQEVAYVNHSLTPNLLKAVSENNTPVALRLLQDNANSNARYDDGDTVLIKAVKDNNVALVKLLVNKEADVNAEDVNHNTALHWVMINGNKPVAKTLNDGQVVHIPPQGSVNEYFIGLLLAKNSNVEKKNYEGKSAFFKACELGNVDGVKYLLLNAKPDINTKDSKEKTALAAACSNGHTEIVRILLENSANVDDVDEEGQSPLMHAVQCENLQVCQALIKKGANPNIRDQTSATALKLAKIRGNKDIVYLLESNSASE